MPERSSRSSSPLATRHSPLALTRRDFLRDAAGLTLGTSLLPGSLLTRSGVLPRDRKGVVITFGGGAQDKGNLATQTGHAFSSRSARNWRDDTIRTLIPGLMSVKARKERRAAGLT